MPQRGVVTGARSRLLSRLPMVAVTAGLLATVAGCGLLGGSSDSSDNGSSNGQVEKATIKVATLPALEGVSLYIAQDRGYFKQEGLNVQIITATSGPAAVQGMVGGQYDIAMSSYPGILAVQAKHVADVKIVSDAYQAVPNDFMLMSTPNSTVHKPSDLPGKKIALTSQGSISDLAPMSELKTQGIAYNNIRWVPMPFPQMLASMKNGDVDGAVLAEPFVTEAAKQLSATPVMDLSSGATANIPLTGWAATSKFVKDNPKTAAAFQRAMAKAQAVASDRKVVEPLLVKYDKLDQQTASLVTLATFPTTADASRIQRVANLMKEFGVIKDDLDVSSMIFKPTGSS